MHDAVVSVSHLAGLAPRGRLRRMQSLGWVLQVLGLVVVGSALLVGLFYEALRTEIAMLAIGGALFLLGRRLYKG